MKMEEIWINGYSVKADPAVLRALLFGPQQQPPQPKPKAKVNGKQNFSGEIELTVMQAMRELTGEKPREIDLDEAATYLQEFYARTQVGNALNRLARKKRLVCPKRGTYVVKNRKA